VDGALAMWSVAGLSSGNWLVVLPQGRPGAPAAAVPSVYACVDRTLPPHLRQHAGTVRAGGNRGVLRGCRGVRAVASGRRTEGRGSVVSSNLTELLVAVAIGLALSATLWFGVAQGKAGVEGKARAILRDVQVQSVEWQ
jgi:hypothetical protein